MRDAGARRGASRYSEVRNSMKKSLLRAAMIACLPFCAMSMAVVANPALAADKADKSEGPKLSKSINKLMVDAKKAMDEKDYKTVVVKCEEAQKTADLTDYDKYLINRFLGVAYFSLGDRDKARANFIAVVKNPGTPVLDRQYLVGPAMSLAAEVNDNVTVIELGKSVIADGTTNPDVLGTLANAYHQTNDYPNAITYAQKGLDMAIQQGKTPQYGLYQILAYSYDKLKDRKNEVKAFEGMARDYGKAEDWGYLIDFSLEFLPAGNKSMREIAALDFYRLRMLVGASWSPSNYLEAADAANAIRSWGDARQVLEMGIDKGVINRTKVAPVLNKTISDSKKDEPILAQVEKTAKNSKDLANVAEAYYGYGRYADAVRAAQKAIEAGGPNAAEAKIVLAMSQIKQGDEATAKQTLANFQGDPALARAAELWNLYLARKYGKAAPAAPAAH
jgi:tetratricopeptide (TPR) repeat protein